MFFRYFTRFRRIFAGRVPVIWKRDVEHKFEYDGSTHYNQGFDSAQLPRRAVRTARRRVRGEHGYDHRRGDLLAGIGGRLSAHGSVRRDVRAVLPAALALYGLSMRNRYLYVTREAEAKINLVLRKEFDVNFTSFLTESRIQGFRLKDIISIFIVKNNMDIFDGDIETLKKRYYRKEIQDLKNLEKKLRQKAYSISKLARRTVTDNIIIWLLTF